MIVYHLLKERQVWVDVSIHLPVHLLDDLLFCFFVDNAVLGAVCFIVIEGVLLI